MVRVIGVVGVVGIASVARVLWEVKAFQGGEAAGVVKVAGVFHRDGLCGRDSQGNLGTQCG